MSSPTSPQAPHGRITRFLPRGRGWWIVAGAFAAGLLLFLLAWSGKRDEFEFYRAEESIKAGEEAAERALADIAEAVAALSA